MSQTIERVFFDTHKAVKNLKAAGFTEGQAEAQTKLISDLIDKDLVTKGHLDLKMSQLELKIEQVKSNLLKWIGGILATQVFLILGIVIALFKLFETG